MSTHSATVRRVDPRRPAQLTPQGLRRIVLGSSEGERTWAHPGHAQAAAKPVRSTGPFDNITVVVTHSDRGSLSDWARQTIAAAAILAGPQTEVVLAVLGPCHDDVAALGVDRLWVAEDAAQGYQPSAQVQWLQAIQQQLSPQCWLIPDSAEDGPLGRRFATQCQLSLAANVVELDALKLRVPADARHDFVRPHAQVMLVSKGIANPQLPFVGLGLHGEAPAWRSAVEAGVEDLGVRSGNPATMALEEADFILAAGNGVTDLPLFHALAQELGAAVGASRVAVDDGRFARAQQVGATGKTVTASAYVAVGISGAVQHLQGIKDCRHVIAINLDASAPITRRADLTLVEDGQRLMQALLDLVRAEKERS